MNHYECDTEDGMAVGCSDCSHYAECNAIFVNWMLGKPEEPEEGK